MLSSASIVVEEFTFLLVTAPGAWECLSIVRLAAPRRLECADRRPRLDGTGLSILDLGTVLLCGTSQEVESLPSSLTRLT